MNIAGSTKQIYSRQPPQSPTPAKFSRKSDILAVLMRSGKHFGIGRGMAILFLIIDGVSFMVSTLWDLQEMRFAAIFNGASSFAITLVVAAVSCFMAMRS